MKKGLLKKSIAALFALSMLIMPCFAVSFSDISGHWAKAEILDVADKGIIQGYTDNTFRPDENVTTLEILVMLSRIYNADGETAALIYKDYSDYLTGLFGTKLSWAHENLAVCLASGIITNTELSALYNGGTLQNTASKELLSVFLVRAMQLESETSTLTSYTLDFDDADSITKLRRPYVYMLVSTGIVKGNSSNMFEPKSNVTRAVTAAMISRAIDYMEANKISADFSKYSERIWISGQISEVNALSNNQIFVTIESDISGKKVLQLGASGITYYLNGYTSSSSSVSAGRYLNAYCTKDNTVLSAYLSSSLTSYKGEVVSADQKSITIKSEEDSKNYTFSVMPYTEVLDSYSEPGKQTSGDSSIISSELKYKDITCLVNQKNELLYLEFLNDVYELKGSIAGVKTEGSNKILTFKNSDGISYVFTVKPSVKISDNGASVALTTDKVGDYAVLSLSATANEVSDISIYSKKDVVQGSIRSISTTSGTTYMYIRNVLTSRSKSYEIAKNDCICYYNGQKTTLSKIAQSNYVTAVLENEKIVEIYTYPEKQELTGNISSISYGKTITLNISQGDKLLSFSFDSYSLPFISRGGDDSSIDKLRTGDYANITTSYGTLYSIDAEDQETDIDGIITKITLEASGNTITIKQSDNNEYSYIVSDSTNIVSSNTSIALSDLRIGYSVSLALASADSNVVSLITVSDALASSEYVSGKILFINYTDKYMLIETYDSQKNTVSTTVNYTDTTKVFNSSGTAYSVEDLDVTDKIIAIGSYSGSVFNAKIIIKLS